MNVVKKMLKNHKTAVKVPKKTQDLLPIDQIYEDGLFYLGHGNWSMSYQFADINYATASREQQTNILLEYGDMINEIDPEAAAKITIICKRMNREHFNTQHRYALKGNTLDVYRQEHNRYLDSIITKASCIVQEKYLTVTVRRKNPEEARSFFSRVAARFATHLHSKMIGSKLDPLNADRRMRLLFDFMRPADQNAFSFDLAAARERGHSFKDYLAPNSYERVDAGCFKLGDQYYRSLYLKDYGSYIKGDFISKLLDVNRYLVLSIDLLPVPTEDAVKEARNRLMGIESNIAKHSRKQVENKNFSGHIPYEFQNQRDDIIAFLDALTKQDQHMFLGVMTICHRAATREDLDKDTASLVSIAQQSCQLETLTWQQTEGFFTALPFGVRCIDAVRSLTTDAASVLHPFRSMDILDEGGVVYGANTISGNVVAVNKHKLKNGNSIVLGASGAAKSATVKREILQTMLQDPNCTVIIIDPEKEYRALVEALGGEIVEISTSTHNRVNAMEISPDYGDEKDPIILKTEFILSFCEQIMGALTAEQKSIISRAVEDTLLPYVRAGFTGTCPTLQNFYHTLGGYDSPAAKHIQVSIELYTVGSFRMFAEQTNIKTKNRLICYDISELGAHMRELGMLVIMDSTWSKITKNRLAKTDSHVYIDEFYLFLQRQTTAEYFFYLWKRIRKYFGFITGVTQNIGDLLRTEMGRAMVANSELLILMSMGAMECDLLADVLKLSDADVKAIREVPKCHGLLKVGAFFLPFDSTIPINTETFQLIDTSH
ncbi:MAG: DUF87 domain-containing protein [Lachnospiraceae bacterium]|nr:DUF87 domain-containing protein [Lachnospiraceae bacterium]